MTIKLDIKEFGDRLIATRDLDPTYVGLRGMIQNELPDDQACRWLLAYWCFYHVGVASYISEYEGSDFWHFMKVAARNDDPNMRPKIILGNPNGVNAGNKNDRWPRAAERRHFRGQKCVDAVEWLQSNNSYPEAWVRGLSGYGTEKEVMAQVQTWPMFGPWIAFKAADMLERCCGYPVKFDPNLGLMYDEPRKALAMLETHPDNEVANNNKAWWYQHLSDYFARTPAPPFGDRMCGPQEVETVLCKWKSYMGGHYHVGKDIHDHRNALVGWGQTAQLMLKYMPERT